MASVIGAPTNFVLDKVFGFERQTTSDGQITLEEEGAIADASAAIDRNDWEAGYRALEGCLLAKNDMVREVCFYQITNHPELREAAKLTFSESSLNNSKAQHGDSAIDIELQRLAIYEHVATKEELVSARINVHKIFPDYQYITDWSLRKEVGTYCPNADLGHAYAQKYIADIYFYGSYNVKQGLHRAYIWYSLAANGGDGNAEERLALVESELTSAQLLDAEQLLEQWEPGQCKMDLFRNTLGLAP